MSLKMFQSPVSEGLLMCFNRGVGCYQITPFLKLKGTLE